MLCTLRSKRAGNAELRYCSFALRCGTNQNRSSGNPDNRRGITPAIGRLSVLRILARALRLHGPLTAFAHHALLPRHIELQTARRRRSAKGDLHPYEPQQYGVEIIDEPTIRPVVGYAGADLGGADGGPVFGAGGVLDLAREGGPSASDSAGRRVQDHGIGSAEHLVEIRRGVPSARGAGDQVVERDNVE